MWRISNLLWFKPKKMEKILKDQGLKGNPYRFMNGDLNEIVQMMSEANSKPMNLSHDIVPRVEPFLHKSITTLGKSYFTWMGTKPMVHVSDPSMIREVLANYKKYEKFLGDNPLARLIGTGLIDAKGDQWDKRRKIINPAFHMEKLKASKSVYIPGIRFLPTKNNKRMKEIHQQVRGLIKGIINKRVVAMKAGEASHDDLLGILLHSNFKEIEEHGNKSFGLSMDDVIEECKIFYVAGQETTGNLLVWTMILLGQHTEWQTRAREEVLHVFGDKKPDINGLSHLKVMSIIFNEVLRLYPPAGYLRRLINDETKLGNLTLPAGTLIEISSLFLHHDKDTWGEDVNEFKPERFSKSVSKVANGQALYLPFGGGPRICIGQNFTTLEAKMAFAMILQCFSFELSPSYSHAPIQMPVLSPQFGAHFILHKL
ncbi:hypothetical protein L1987_27012 [Smallanthus sonchifolius]|uniref:Uncharacterized protein n=1 Tax=Smallanthus sonchifolius TaxID=185202 RepID=A0ACB9IAI0_9ASTR|nr:hypothetical protein L1987_27012 [Smallanthus sonchifolius]